MIDQGDVVSVGELVAVEMTTAVSPPVVMGRPPKLTKELMQRICFLARKGLTDAEVAYALGVNESSITRWKRSQTFHRMLDEAKGEPNFEVESSLFMLAKPHKVQERQVRQIRSGTNTAPDHVEEIFTERNLPPELGAVKLWLERRMAHRWGPIQAPLVQQNVAVVGSITVQKQQLVREFREYFGEDADRVARELAAAIGYSVPVEANPPRQ